MSVREGAFDPGPPPPEPVREVSASEADAKSKEDLRERCLRRLKEQEQNEAQPYPDAHAVLDFDLGMRPIGVPIAGDTPISDADPGDEMFVPMHKIGMRIALPPGRIVVSDSGMVMLDTASNGPTLVRMTSFKDDVALSQRLLFQFETEDGKAGRSIGAFFPIKCMSARQVANELHKLAHRIEKGLCG